MSTDETGFTKTGREAVLDLMTQEFRRMRPSQCPSCGGPTGEMTTKAALVPRPDGYDFANLSTCSVCRHQGRTYAFEMAAEMARLRELLEEGADIVSDYAPGFSVWLAKVDAVLVPK